MPKRDSLEKTLTKLAAEFLDRWIFGSQWANVWGDGAVSNFQNFAADLHSISNNLNGSESAPASLIKAVEDSIEKLMQRVLVKSIEQIDSVLVLDRRRVHTYYPFLWVWHRLDASRWKNSSIQMRTEKKRTTKLEVDHTVADAWWANLVETETTAKLASFTGTDDEKALLAPADFESKSEALAFINRLGNCSLLDKSFNISKNAGSMRDFITQVHEFQNGEISLEDWEAALSLDLVMTSPQGRAAMEIKSAIQTRDDAIRKDLSDFIKGDKRRVDLDD